MLELPQAGLRPFIESELLAAHGKNRVSSVTKNWRGDLRWIDEQRFRSCT